MKLNQALQKMGLSEIEVEIYLSLLKIRGAQPASIVANRINANRTTTYKALTTLAKKGLVTKTLKHGIICFFAEDPEEKLESMLYQKKRMLEEANKVILEALPTMMMGDDANPNLPKIRYYEGIDGIKQIYEMILKERVDYYRYGDISKIYETLGSFTDEFIKKRIKAGIKVKAIMPLRGKNKKMDEKNKKESRDVIYIPYDLFPIEGEIRIFGDKVAISSLRKEALIGVVIECEPIAKMFRSIFMLSWKEQGKKKA